MYVTTNLISSLIGSVPIDQIPGIKYDREEGPKHESAKDAVCDAVMHVAFNTLVKGLDFNHGLVYVMLRATHDDHIWRCCGLISLPMLAKLVKYASHEVRIYVEGRKEPVVISTLGSLCAFVATRKDEIKSLISIHGEESESIQRLISAINEVDKRYKKIKPPSEAKPLPIAFGFRKARDYLLADIRKELRIDRLLVPGSRNTRQLEDIRRMIKENPVVEDLLDPETLRAVKSGSEKELKVAARKLLKKDEAVDAQRGQLDDDDGDDDDDADFVADDEINLEDSAGEDEDEDEEDEYENDGFIVSENDEEEEEEEAVSGSDDDDDGRRRRGRRGSKSGKDKLKKKKKKEKKDKRKQRKRADEDEDAEEEEEEDTVSKKSKKDKKKKKVAKQDEEGDGDEEDGQPPRKKRRITIDVHSDSEDGAASSETHKEKKTVGEHDKAPDTERDGKADKSNAVAEDDVKKKKAKQVNEDEEEEEEEDDRASKNKSDKTKKKSKEKESEKKKTKNVKKSKDTKHAGKKRKRADSDSEDDEEDSDGDAGDSGSEDDDDGEISESELRDIQKYTKQTLKHIDAKARREKILAEEERERKKRLEKLQKKKKEEKTKSADASGSGSSAPNAAKANAILNYLDKSKKDHQQQQTQQDVPKQPNEKTLFDVLSSPKFK